MRIIITALFFFGTNETSVEKSLNAKIEDSTFRDLFFKNDCGISNLLDLIVPKYSWFLRQSEKLLKKLSAVFNLLVL